MEWNDVRRGGLRDPARTVSALVGVLVLVSVLVPWAAASPGGKGPVPAATSSVLLTGSFSNMVMDPFRDRLYLASTTGSVVVWNTSTDKEMTSVSVGAGPYGMDVSPNGTELYVALTGAAALGVVNLTTLKETRVIPLAVTPYDVAAGRTGRAYVTTNEYPGYPRIVDTIGDRVLGNITSAGLVFPDAFVRASPDRSLLYLGDDYESPAPLYKFSITTDSVPLVSEAPFNSIGGNLRDMVVTEDGSQLFVACGGPAGYGYYVQGLYASNWTTSAELTTGPYPISVAVDQRATYAFGANTGSTVYGFNVATHVVIANLTFSQGVFRIRSVPDGTRLYALTSATGVGPGSALEELSTGLSASSSEPPLAYASANVTYGYAPLSVAFTGIAYLGTPPYSATWSFGDGTQSSAADVGHVYTTPGAYTATFRVVDASGYTATQSVSVVAGAAPTPGTLAVSTQFPGIGFSFTSNDAVPPDPQVAAGPGFVLEMVNTRYQIWSRDGLPLGGGSLTALFQTAPTDFLTDPKVVYDGLSGRWFASIDDLNTTAVLLAVSTTSNPLGPWSLSSYASAACPDQPFLGIGRDVVVLSVNDFSSCTSSGTFSGAEYWVVNKTERLQGGTAVYEHVGPFPGRASLYPVEALTPSPTFYLMTVGWALNPTTALTLYALTGSPPGPVTTTTVNLTVRTINQPPNGVQPGTPYLVNTGDSRVQDAFAYGNTLWAALGDACFPAGTTQNRSCLRLLQIDTSTPAVLQDFDVGQAGTDSFYPSIARDAAGDLVVVFGFSSATAYPGIAVTSQQAGDPVDSVRAPLVIQAGTGPEDLWCPDGVSCRYGDYFGASVDPLDPEVVWTAGEYGTPSGWQTEVTAVGTFAPVSLTFNYSLRGGGTPPSGPALVYFSRGATETTALSPAPQVYEADRNSTWVVLPLLLGTTLGERWVLYGPFAGNATVPATETFPFQHQFLVNVTAGPAGGGSTAAESGWYNASSPLTLSATAAPGWKFMGWQGTGAGSYTGPRADADATVSGVITEAGQFDPGLTLTASFGGSVAYSYGNATGVVPSGSTVTIYVPLGTSVSLTASAGLFGSFVGWSGAVTGNGFASTYVVMGPAHIQAQFGLETTAFLLLGVLVVVAVALIAIVVLRRRRKATPAPPAVAPAVTPPPGAAPGSPDARPPEEPPPPGPPPG